MRYRASETKRQQLGEWPSSQHPSSPRASEPASGRTATRRATLRSLPTSPWSLTALFLAFAVLLGVLASTSLRNDSDTSRAGGAAAFPAAPVVTSEENPDLLVRGVVDRLPAPDSLVELSRVRLATGTVWELVVPGPMLYGVESGALGIRVDGPAILMRAGADGAPEEAASGIDFTLRPGDQMVVLAGTPHTLGNDGGESAAFLTLAIFPVSSAIPSWLPEAERPPGIDLQPLATDLIMAEVAPPSGPVEITVATSTLSPGDKTSLPPDGFRLLVVDTGTLVLASDAPGDEDQTFAAGEVARLAPAVEQTARNDGQTPLVVLSVGIRSAGDDRGSTVD